MDKLLDLYFDIKESKPERVQSLKNLWKSYTGCEYPRIKNKKGKEVDFLKHYKPENKQTKTTNGLDDLINSKRTETDIINSVLYSKSYSDIPDPYRKRRKP